MRVEEIISTGGLLLPDGMSPEPHRAVPMNGTCIKSLMVYHR